MLRINKLFFDIVISLIVFINFESVTLLLLLLFHSSAFCFRSLFSKPAYVMFAAAVVAMYFTLYSKRQVVCQSVSLSVSQSVRPYVRSIDLAFCLIVCWCVCLAGPSLNSPGPGCGDVMLGGSCGFRCCVSIIMHKTFFVLQSSSQNVGISVYFWTFNQSHLVLKRCSRCRTSFCIQRKPTTTKTENISDKKEYKKFMLAYFSVCFLSFVVSTLKKNNPFEIDKN